MLRNSEIKVSSFYHLWWKQMAGTDLRALSVMRIFIGLILFCDLFTRSMYLTAHYTDQGVLPRNFMTKMIWEKWFFSIHAWNGTFLWELFLFCLAGIFAGMLLVGYKTKLATLVSWLFLISLQNRNQYLLNGGDVLLRMTLFWSIFLPLGARFSLDSFRNKVTSALQHEFISLAGFAFLVQVFFIYFFAGFSKLNGLWGSGFAMLNVVQMGDFVTRSAIKLTHFPILLKGLNYYIFYSQLILPFFLFSPLRNSVFRNAVLINFVGLQLFIAIFFKLGIFPWVCVAVQVGLFPSSLINLIGSYLTQFKNHFSKRKVDLELSPVSGSLSGSKSNLLENRVVLFFLLYIFWWNLFSFDLVAFPKIFKPIGFILRIDQKWDMFRSESITRSVSPVIILVDENGKEIKMDGFLRSTLRSRNYTYYLPFVNDEEFRTNYCNFVCRDWNQSHLSGEKAQAVNLFVNELNFQRDQPAKRNFHFFKSYPCNQKMN